jgi:hypothetical protein
VVLARPTMRALLHLPPCLLPACPAVPEGQAFVEQYGLLSPIPDHDGTECLKWDPTLWSHADHFKV